MTGSPTATERTAIRTGYAALHTAKSPNSEIVEQIVYALGSAGLLQSPETAAEMQRYEALSSQECPKGLHADWLVDSENTHQCPWCRIAELEAAAAESRPVDEDPIAYELTPVALVEDPRPALVKLKAPETVARLRWLMGGGPRV